MTIIPLRKLGEICVLMLVILALFSGSAAAADPPWMSGASEPEDLEIKLVIFGPGDDVPSWFGHIAMVVEDKHLNTQRLYNYGMFSFDSAMLAKFAMGRLWFWVGQSSVIRTYEAYRREGRSVRVLTLNLPDEERLEMARYLAWNVLPENRDYLYDHYYDNCSTRLRDLIDKAVGGQLKAATEEPSGFTLRDHTRRHAHHHPAMDLLLMFMMNDSIDEPISPWEEMFLPGELEKVLKDFKYIDPEGEEVALVSEELVYAEDTIREPIPERPPTRWPGALLLGALIGGLGALLGWRYFKAGGDPKDKSARGWRVGFGLHHALVGLILGIPGTALFVMSLLTDHNVTYFNENLFLANPLSLLICPLGIGLAFGSARAQRWLRVVWLVLVSLAVLLLPLKLIPAFDQDNWFPMAFILPIILGFGLIWWRSARRGEPALAKEDSAGI